MESAQHALIDPLIEPEPSEETGLNTHFRSTFAPQEPITPPGPVEFTKDPSSAKVVQPQKTGTSVETNPYRRSRAASESKSVSTAQYTPSSTPRSSKHSDYPSPPNSASPHHERFPDAQRSEASASLNEARSRRMSNPPSKPPSAHNNASRHTRSHSLRERYPGDKSHMPLEQLRKDVKIAHRAPHLRRQNFQGADIIDRLDKSGLSQYHHEGPFDAANIARNRYIKHSPMAAVHRSNVEALRATPRENIIDAITKHRPLEGVANIPPGIPDRFGRVLNYEEGTDLQRDFLTGGDYRRVPGVVYHPDDLKGKGEPFFSADKAWKDQKRLGISGTELRTSRQYSKSVSHADAPANIMPGSLNAESSGIGRRNTIGQGMGGSLRKRFGSLQLRKSEVDI